MFRADVTSNVRNYRPGNAMGYDMCMKTGQMGTSRTEGMPWSAWTALTKQILADQAWPDQ